MSEGVADKMARAKLPRGQARTETILTMLTPAEKKAVDRVAKQRDRTRSSVVRAALLEFLKKRGKKVIATNG